VVGSLDGQISDFWTLKLYPGWYTGDELRQSGYDFVRFPVNPVVLLQNPPAVRARLINEIEKGMQPYISAHLRIIFDLQFWGPEDKVWTNEEVSSNPAGLEFAAYREIVREIAARLDGYPHGQVALELMNEPSAKYCPAGGWIAEQKILLGDVRNVAAQLPVIVTGCGGQLDGLLALNASKINMKDRNLLFTFHFYEPYLFTAQGSYRDYIYIEGIRYPASVGRLRSTLAMTYRNIDAANLSSSGALAAKLRDAEIVSWYYNQSPGREFIEKRFSALAVWAQDNKVLTSRIILGEFAAINWRKHDTMGYFSSRIHWDEDVQSAADRAGIASAYWNLPYPKGPTFR
jgi:hypothetical protein